MNEDAEQDVVERENRKNIFISQEMEPYHPSWNYKWSTKDGVREDHPEYESFQDGGVDPVFERREYVLDPEPGSREDIVDPESGRVRDIIGDPASEIRGYVVDPESGSRLDAVDPRSGSRLDVVDPRSGSIRDFVDPVSGSREYIVDPVSGSREYIVDPVSGSREYIVDPDSEKREDLEPDSLKCEAVSQNNEGSSRYDDEEERNDDEYDDDDFDDDDFDEEEFDAIAEDDDEEIECNELDDENEHWYNGVSSGEYVWRPYSEEDESKGEYVWQPVLDKTKEVYWGNVNKSEEWIPQEIEKKTKKKKKKHWIPQMVARKEMGKTVWYYMLPSTEKPNKLQKQSLKHIPKLIKGKGSDRWFSQIVSTKDKKSKTVWYCKLTPMGTEQEGESGDIDPNAVTQADTETTTAKTFDDNPEPAQQVEVGAESLAEGEHCKNILQNEENPVSNSLETNEETGETGNSTLVPELTEEQITRIRKKSGFLKMTKTEWAKKPSLQIPENSVPKLIQVQIWNPKKAGKDDQLSNTASAPKENAKGGWFPKLGKPQKEKRTKQLQAAPNQKGPMENNDQQIDNCLLQIPQMTKSLIEDDQPQQATAIWYDDA